MDEPTIGKDTGQTQPGQTLQADKAKASAQAAATSAVPKTYTEEEIKKQVSDALAKQGREIKSLTKERDSVFSERDTLKTRLSELESKIDEMELNQVKGDPDLEKAYKDKRSIQKALREAEEAKRKADAEIAEARAKLEEEKGQHAEKLKRADELDQKILVFEIAKKRGVDLQILEDKVIKYGLQAEEAIDDLAQTLSTGKTVSKPDSGVTSGGKIDFSQMTPRQKIEEGLLQQSKKK